MHDTAIGNDAVNAAAAQDGPESAHARTGSSAPRDREKRFMKTRYPATLATLACFGLGVLTIQALRVEPARPAYFVTEFDTESEQEIMNTDYPSLAPGTFQPFGGHYTIYNGRTITFDGTPHARIVVIAFDSMEKLQAWHASNAFKNLYNLHRTARVRAFAVEGVDQVPDAPAW